MSANVLNRSSLNKIVKISGLRMSKDFSNAFSNLIKEILINSVKVALFKEDKTLKSEHLKEWFRGSGL